MTEAKIMFRQITNWLHGNFMAAPDRVRRAAGIAWRSCEVADRPDNDNEICQRLHKLDLATFASELAAWGQQFRTACEKPIQPERKMNSTSDHNKMLIERIKGAPASAAVDPYAEAQKNLAVASIELRAARSALEEAEASWKQAIDDLDALEQQSLPSFQEMRGILK